MALYDWFARRSEARQQLTYAENFATGTTSPWYLATGSRSVMFSKISDDIPAVQIARAGAGNSVQLTFPAKLGITYQPQGSDDLANWTDEGTPIVPTSDSNQSVTLTPTANALRKFYRLAVIY